jgi:hypothetical protein
MFSLSFTIFGLAGRMTLDSLMAEITVADERIERGLLVGKIVLLLYFICIPFFVGAAYSFKRYKI